MALVVGGIAVALGGAALFGMVAHTWTPYLPQKGAVASPFDSVARAPAVFVGSVQPDPLERNRGRSIPVDPRAGEFNVAQTPVPPHSLTQLESVVAHAEPLPVVAAIVDAKPLESGPTEPAPPRVLLADLVAIEPPAVETKVAEAPAESKPVVIRVADVKVVGAGATRATQTELRLVHFTAKPAEPRRVEPKPAMKPVPPKVAEAKPAAPKVVHAKAAAPKVAEPKVAEPKAVAPKLAEARSVAPKVGQPRQPAQKVADAKPAAPKAPDAKSIVPRIEPRPVFLKVGTVSPPEAARAEPRRDAKAPEPTRAELQRAADIRAAEAKRADVKRAADMKAAEAKLAEAKRAAESRAASAEAKLAEAMRAAEAKAMEWKLAELKRAAEAKEAEDRLAESQRAFETRAAEVRLAETKRAVETTLAEAKLAQAKLAETKRAVEMTLAQKAAMENRAQPASQIRPALPRYESCDTCGTVSSVMSRSRDYGVRNWEVRVNFPDGAERVFLFPTDPGFSRGERVRFEAGRLTSQAPRRAANYSPA